MDTNKILVLHHNDRDGNVSAAIVGDFYENYAEGDFDITYLEMDYSKSIDVKLYVENINVDAYSTIYLVDYSVSNADNYNFIRTYRDKLIWIDHHKSTFDFLNSLESPLEFAGLRCDGASAALLAWAYFHEGDLCDHLRNAKRVSRDRLRELIQKDVTDKGFNIPMLVWYTHKYDTWDIDNDVEAFNFGQYKIDIKYYMTWLRTCKYNMHEDNFTIKSCIEHGFSIRAYTIECNEKHIKQFGVPFTLRYNGKSYKALMINMPQPTSLKFGKYADMYEILIPFYYNGEGYTYSLYKTNISPEELDVAKIACDVFDGGGHKNAAGFSISNRERQFRPKRNSIFTIDD